MAKQIVCNIILCLNFLIYNIVFIYKLKNYGRNINKYKQPVTINRVGLEILKIIGISFIALIISSICCVFDGLSNEKYLPIPFIFGIVFGFLVCVLLDIYFSKTAKKYIKPDARTTFGLSLFLGPMYTTIIGHFIYTVILIFI